MISKHDYIVLSVLLYEFTEPSQELYSETELTRPSLSPEPMFLITKLHWHIKFMPLK